LTTAVAASTAPSRTALRCALGVLAVAPAVYLLVAVQYSAITFPFWDHAELIRFLQAYYDGTLRLSDLWQPHNHSRPFTYRLAYVVNAVMTGWDIRSEYLLLLLSIYGAYAIHLRTLGRIGTHRASMSYACCAVVLSLFFFSPVGHNNHWWSMMLQLDLSSLFIAYALLRVSFDPDRWRTHVSAAIACWLATYTLTNGLIAFLAIISALWLARYPRLRPDRYIVFWLVNFAAVLAVYLPGLPHEPGGRPSVVALVEFCLVYLGAPLGGLIFFPYRGNFDLPQALLLNGVCGALLVAYSGWLLWKARDDVRRGEPSAMILLLLFLFAAGSAIATAWGRAAFDAYGIANANGSRYSIFSSYLIFGVIYRIAGLFARASTRSDTRWLGVAVMATLTVLGTITYARGWHVYAVAHDFNRELAVAYQSRGPAELDKYIFPDPSFVENLKSALARLELGPYRDLPSHRAELPRTNNFSAPVAFSAAARIVQRFKADRGGLKGIEIQTVTHGKRRGTVDMAWKLYEVAEGGARLYAAGVVPASRIGDWQTVRLRVGPAWNSAGREYELALEAVRADAGDTGVPAYEAVPHGDAMQLVQPDGTRRAGPGTLNVSLIYVD
jgi:hypothetical protein